MSKKVIAPKEKQPSAWAAPARRTITSQRSRKLIVHQRINIPVINALSKCQLMAKIWESKEVDFLKIMMGVLFMPKNDRFANLKS